jgi:hypothetical protein
MAEHHEDGRARQEVRDEQHRPEQNKGRDRDVGTSPDERRGREDRSTPR